VNNTPSSDDSVESDQKLDLAFRQRRIQQLADRTEPGDPASGTAGISARLAQARADELSRPRVAREIIDLT